MLLLASLDIALQSRWPLLLLPLALLMAWLGYRHTTPALLGGQRLPFVALRSLSFALLLLILASPVLNRVRNEPLKPRIAVLVDESLSMSTNDASSPEGSTRLRQARDVVQAVQREFAGKDVDVEVVAFGTQVRPPLQLPSYLAEPHEALEPGTDILGALRETADRLAGQNLQSMLLISDGRPTRGALDAADLAALGRPVFVVGMGDSARARDLAIDRCEYGPIAYVESESSIQVRVENSGFRGRSTLLRLMRGRRELFRKKLSFETDYGRTQIEIPLELKTPGRQRLQLVLDSLDDEVTERNNTREIRIEVLKNRMKVLFVAAKPDWDVGFLARLLRDDPNVDVTLVHQDRAQQWTDAVSGAAFVLPRTAQEIRDYDLFIMGSPGQQAPVEYLNLVVESVERGRALLVLPGRQSVYTSRDAFEALSRVLPVQRQQRKAPQYRVYKARLTPQGRLHPASSALAALTDEASILQRVPPLLARHVELSAKPGAVELLVTDTGQVQALLAVARSGNGHTAALTGFPLWRWMFTPDEAVRTAQTEFLGHLVRWLTQPRDIKRVQIASSKPVYEGGENVELFSQVLDPQFEPLTDAEVRVEVRRKDGERETVATLLLEHKSNKLGEYAGQLSGVGPGEYEAEAVAERLGQVVGRDTTEFTLEAYSVEFANTSQDVDFLRELAQRTGGDYATVAGAAQLSAALPRASQPLLLRSEIEVWNSKTMFILFVLALAAEWLLRKRRGLL